MNIHIASSYHPPKAGKRTAWAPNPGRFSDLFAGHPDRLQNLHFAFVVTLRALRKASPLLYNYNFTTGAAPESVGETARTSLLVRRLLDTYILSSCSEVFEAYVVSMRYSLVVVAHVVRIW